MVQECWGENERLRSQKRTRNRKGMIQKHTHALIKGSNQGAQLYHRCQQALPESCSTRSIRYPGELRQELGHNQYDGNNALIIPEDHASNSSERSAERRIIISEDTAESWRPISISTFPHRLRLMYENVAIGRQWYVPFLCVTFHDGHS